MRKNRGILLILALITGCQIAENRPTQPASSASLLPAQIGPTPTSIPTASLPPIASPAPEVPNILNKAPVIQTLAANPNNTTDKNGVMSFTLNILDTNGDALDIRWKASSGRLSSEQGLSVEWRATDFDGQFQPGKTEIVVIVTDQQGHSVTGKLAVWVDANGSTQVQNPEGISPPVREIADIEVNQSDFFLDVNETTRLSAQLRFRDGSVGTELSWESAQPQIVSVNGRGDLFRHASGEVVIVIRSALHPGFEKRVTVKDRTNPLTSGGGGGGGSASGNTGNTGNTASAPAVPVAPSLGPISTQSAEIQWVPVSGATSYYLYLNEQKWPASFTALSHLFENLTPGTTYTVKVSAVNSAGESGLSLPLTFTTQAPIPGTPQNLRTTQVNANQIALAWDLSNGAATYNLYLGGNPAALGLTGSSHLLTGLASNTAYQLELSALNATGESGKTALNVTTPLNIPAPPGNLQASNILTNRLQLNWDAVPSASTYKIYLEGNYFGAATAAQENLTGLLSGTEYTIEVTAANLDGESTPSSSLWVVTQGAPGQIIARVYDNALNDTYFAVSSSHFFFMNQSGKLQKVAIQGGEQSAFASSNQTTLAQGYSFNIREIQADENFVYFMHGTGLYKVATSGGTVSTLASTSASFQVLRMDSDNLYWLDTGNGQVNKISKSGGTVSTLASGLASPGSSLAVDDTAVYFVDNSLIKKVSKTGGSVSSVNDSQPGGGSSRLAVGGGQLFWIGGLTGNGSYGIYKMSTSGGTFTKIVAHNAIGTGFNFGPLTLYQNELYFTANKKIYKVGTDGSGFAQMATNPDTLSAILADGQHVYFSQNAHRGIKKLVK